MKIEQRQSIRKKVSLKVLVNHDLAYSRRLRVFDLSLSGALLEAQDPISAGTPVEAVFTLKEHDRYDFHRVPAEVVRAGGRGMALRFRNYDDRTYTALVNLLYGA